MKTTGFLSEMDRYLFGHGTHYEIYKKLGSHPTTIDKKKGIYFAVWAPNAKSVSLVGNFNNWDISKNPMTLIPESGIFEIFTTEIAVGEIYKYAICSSDNRIIYKADPYAIVSEHVPGTASVVSDSLSFKWNDKKWLKKRSGKSMVDVPVSIYEIHPASWKKHRDEHGCWDFTYQELAVELVSYIKEMGYTHVELLGIPEHLQDLSYGNQVTGYYAPTSRYGAPEDFAYLVNYLHNQNIGVILNWTAAYFSKDSHGLSDFDGQNVYEYADSTKKEYPLWQSRLFDLGRNQVRNFLIANALFWIEQYHIDGLHVSGVDSMLYPELSSATAFNHTQKSDKTLSMNLYASEFIKHLNSIVQKRNPNVIMISDSSNQDTFTVPTENGGFGFTLVWNTNWKKNFLDYIKYDPYFRQFNHSSLTTDAIIKQHQSVLPISHQDLTNGLGSVYQKIPGDKQSKLANMKVAYTLQIGYPGKKLLFMGQDFGQSSEWDINHQLDWYLQYMPSNRSLQNFVADLQNLYKRYSSLYTDSSTDNNFQWMNANDNNRSIYSFIRTSPRTGANLLFILNFTPVSYPKYAVGVPKKGKYTLILDEMHGLLKETDSHTMLTSTKEICDGQSYRLEYNLPAFGIAVFKY